jgi:hypothetical protein
MDHDGVCLRGKILEIVTKDLPMSGGLLQNVICFPAVEQSVDHVPPRTVGDGTGPPKN